MSTNIIIESSEISVSACSFCPLRLRLRVAVRGEMSGIRRKLVIVGDGACGKTSLLSVFALGEFPETYEPTIFEVSSLLASPQGRAPSSELKLMELDEIRIMSRKFV